MHRKFMAGVLMIFAGIAIGLSAFIPVEDGTAAGFWLPLISGVLWISAGCVIAFKVHETTKNVESPDGNAG